MMCEHMHFLAQIDNFRWVAICEHGKIHLSWDHLVLFMTPGELDKLGVTLDVAITEDQRFRHHRDALQNDKIHWSVPEQGHFVVWIGHYAIQLSPVDYLLFGSMLSKALNNLMPEVLSGEYCSVAMKVEEK
ncbi:MAG: hypothetical protein AAGD96_13185, partial [Chloroflexota bacterium]